MVKEYFYKIIIIFIFILSANRVFAANINVVPGKQAGSYDVIISLNESESFNAISGAIILSGNVSAPSIDIKDSIIPLWTEKPSISDNKINFSGIIPGGFSVMYDQFGGQPKREGKLFSIVFSSAQNVTVYTFITSSIKIYANDGHGTVTSLPLNTFTWPVTTNKNVLENSTISMPQSASFHLKSQYFFIFLLALFLAVCFYLAKKTHRHIKKIFKK
jgi:hypothetical protein